MMKKLSWMLLLSLLVGWSGAVGANAQGFDVTIAVTASIGKDGFSMENSTVNVSVNTTMNGWDLSSSTTLSLGFALIDETLSASGKVSDYNVSNSLSMNLKDPMTNTLTVSTKLGSWDLSSVTVLSIAMDFSQIGLTSETLKAATTTKDGVKLSSAGTFSLEGFQKKVISVSGMVNGVNLAQTIDIGKTGLNKLTMKMSTAVDGLNLSNATVYTAEGFSSDTISISGTMDKYDWTCSKSFGKTGWTGIDMSVSTKMDQLDLMGKLSWTPEGFGGASLTASTEFKGLGK